MTIKARKVDRVQAHYLRKIQLFMWQI